MTTEGGQPPASEGTQITEPKPVEQSSNTTPPDSMVVDGRKVVFESDLIASKKSSEEKFKQATDTHSAAVDKLQLENSASLQQISELNAKLSEATQARETGAASAEDVAKAAQELETAKTSLSTSEAKALELKRANIVLQSQGAVQAEHLAEKSMAQLEAFEEALKAVSQSVGGPGAYASGAGAGSTVPETPMERARRVLDSTPVRGVRTPQVNNSA